MGATSELITDTKSKKKIIFFSLSLLQQHDVQLFKKTFKMNPYSVFFFFLCQSDASCLTQAQRELFNTEEEVTGSHGTNLN